MTAPTTAGVIYVKLRGRILPERHRLASAKMARVDPGQLAKQSTSANGARDSGLGSPRCSQLGSTLAITRGKIMPRSWISVPLGRTGIRIGRSTADSEFRARLPSYRRYGVVHGRKKQPRRAAKGCQKTKQPTWSTRRCCASSWIHGWRHHMGSLVPIANNLRLRKLSVILRHDQY
jgi:hypothetical protein